MEAVITSFALTVLLGVVAVYRLRQRKNRARKQEDSKEHMCHSFKLYTWLHKHAQAQESTCQGCRPLALQAAQYFAIEAAFLSGSTCYGFGLAMLLALEADGVPRGVPLGVTRFSPKKRCDWEYDRSLSPGRAAPKVAGLASISEPCFEDSVRCLKM